MNMAKQYAVAAIAIVLIVLGGVVHGDLTNRWRLSRQLGESVGRLKLIPAVIGDWTDGVEIPPDETMSRQLELGDYVGSTMRRYKNRRTGDVISLMVFSGRPGPVATHDPETCYGGSGYITVDKMYFPDRNKPAQWLDWADKKQAPRPEFFRADFVKTGAILPSRLRIYWSWSPDGKWRAVGDPRMEYASQRCLYKIYVVRELSLGSPGAGVGAADPGAEFLKVAMPVLQEALFYGPAPSPSTKATAQRG
jgi:hypothetical protein